MDKPRIDIEIKATESPEGTVVANERSRTAVVIDRKSNRAWTAEGETDNSATTEAVRRFLDDRRSKEYVG